MEKSGEEVGPKHSPDLAVFWFRRKGMQSFGDFQGVCAKHMNKWNHELERRGRSYVLTVHNGTGRSFSVIHRHYFGQVIRGILGVTPNVEIHGNSVVFAFSDPEAGGTQAYAGGRGFQG